MKFINRTKELKDLNEKWETNISQLFVIYGKRRVGKTELVKQFLKDKPAIYFLADKRNHADQLKELGRVVGNYFEDKILVKNGFQDWIEFFEYIANKGKQPLAIAIDEYPYLVESDGATSSLFQKGWDQYLKDSKVFFILLGSSIAMMESETLIHISPLFGRRTGQILVDPMTFANSWKFFPKKDFNDFMSTYSITDGMPSYLLQMDGEKTIKENIETKIFSHTEFLYNEVEFMLREELREPKNYLSILKSISWGKRKFGEIVNDTGLKKNIITKYLTTLERLRLIEKEVPVTEKNPGKSRKGLYKISDNFFRFWFQYVFPFKSDLEIGRYARVLEQFDKLFNTLEAVVYENVCQELILDFEKQLFPIERVGKWWEKEKEIDVVALSEKENKIVFGECKWSSKQVGTNILRELEAKAKYVQWGRGKRKEFFILFSKSGFTDDMKKLAKERKDIILIEGNKLAK
ncbi:MAG: ATP-binding protein [Candidatus Moranbacteria bacterium]|nr:ATP-binding protein [Candidatus Moranbacteria bacterium]